MKRYFALVLLGLSFCLAGCGSDSSEKVTQDIIQYLKNANTILETVKDDASLTAAQPQLEVLGRELKALQTRMKKLGKPDPATDLAIQVKYEAEINVQMRRFTTNLTTISKNPKITKARSIIEMLGFTNPETQPAANP